MKKEVVQAYIDAQVQSRSDALIKPLTNAIANEVTVQKDAAARLKKFEEDTAKTITESRARVTKYQEQLDAAKSDVAAFASQLSTDTTGAVE